MTPRVVVFDYGSGNIRSAQRALEHARASVEVTSDGRAARAADGLVVPGVGAFAACMASLRKVDGESVVRDRVAESLPVLGICVGHQVLFDRGDEHGLVTEGVGIWHGDVTQLDAPVLPHIGWNTVAPPTGSAMFAGIGSERFYFVHSYGVHTAPVRSREDGADPVAAWTSYGNDDFVSAVEAGPVWATQFHPEKSGDAGITLLRNWIATL